MIERRKNPRVFFEDTVRYETPQLSIATIAYDISEHGMFIKTLRPEAVGTRIKLLVPNLDPTKPSRKIPVTARVVRTFNVDGYPRGMVVVFSGSNKSDTLEMIRNYVRDNRFYISDVRFLKAFYEMDEYGLDESEHDIPILEPEIIDEFDS